MQRWLSLHRAILAVCLCSCVTAAPGIVAQTAPAAPSAGSSTAAPAGAAQYAAAQLTENQETQQYTLSHERYEKAISYSRARYKLYFISFFFSVAVLLVLLRLGVPARFRDWAEDVSGNRFVQLIVFVPLLVLTLDVFDLIPGMYGHLLSLRYGQSVQRWGSWFWDWAKGEFLGILLACVLVAILFAVIRWSPRRWWFHFWLAALPILLFVIFISPWFVDPLFNKFYPLDAKHAELVSAIERVVQRAGLSIPRERMFLMQASSKTNSLNAYVTGFGASKRVVVWDTTIQKMRTDETLFVFGHEMGHYVLGHIRDELVFLAALLLALFYLAFRGLHAALGRWGAVWGIHGPEDWASLAVMILLLTMLLFVAAPIECGFSRMQEHAADVYGLEVIHGLVPNSPQVAAHAFQVLGEVDLSDPNPPAFITFWLYSHPPLADRLVFAHSYDPWSKHEQPKYVK